MIFTLFTLKSNQTKSTDQELNILLLNNCNTRISISIISFQVPNQKSDQSQTNSAENKEAKKFIKRDPSSYYEWSCNNEVVNQEPNNSTNETTNGTSNDSSKSSNGAANTMEEDDKNSKASKFIFRFKPKNNKKLRFLLFICHSKLQKKRFTR